MKKPLLILLCLIGLGAFNQVSAQNDLDIVNTSSCDFTVYAADIDPTCTSSTSGSVFVSAGSIFTFTLSGAPSVVVKLGIVDCAGINSVGLWDLTMCGWGNNLTAVLPPTACCPVATTITFTPATPTTNAIVTF